MSSSPFMLNYPRDDVFTYSNDDEYRACFAQVFSLTKDEDGAYVMNTVFINRKLRDLYKVTRENPLFSELYTLAMQCMGSSDPIDGMLLLCSYACLSSFHGLISDFCKNKWDDWSEQCHQTLHAYLMGVLAKAPAQK